MSDQLPPGHDYEAGIIEDVRPWGKFRRFPHADVSSVKIITVEPGGRLSLQYHEGRAEFWVILDPGLEVTLGNRVWVAAPDEEFVVPRRTVHRVRNVGDRAARVMELWLGPSTEEDIVRLSDDYRRGQ